MPAKKKLCTNCGGGPWPPQRFYLVGRSNKRMGECKTCRLKYQADMRHANIESYREYHRRREQRPDVKAQRRAYRQTAAGKEAAARARKWWRLTHPELYRDQLERSCKAQKLKRDIARAEREKENDLRQRLQRDRERDGGMAPTGVETSVLR